MPNARSQPCANPRRARPATNLKGRSTPLLSVENPRVGVGILLVDESGRLLLTLRRRPPEAGCWSIVGGKLDYLETLEQCAVRETLEEVGAAISLDSSAVRDRSSPARRRPALGFSCPSSARVEPRHPQLRAGQNAGSPLVSHGQPSPKSHHHRSQCHRSL